jgi:hypothetical protein
VKQPTEGGSYVYDPKKDDLKQVEKPTKHIDPNLKPAEAPSAPAAEVEGSDPQKKGK